MAWKITTPVIGTQPISVTDTVQNHPLGDTVEAADPALGYGEAKFIYLKGVASTVVGSVVTYDGATAGVPTFQTVLAPSTAVLAQPLAIAQSANVANQYGWYLMAGGVSIVSTNGTLAAGPGPVYLAGSGQVTSTAAAGKQIMGARNLTATGTPATNQALVQFSGAIMAQGAIT
jgi:hypothetical protein